MVPYHNRMRLPFFWIRPGNRLSLRKIWVRESLYQSILNKAKMRFLSTEDNQRGREGRLLLTSGRSQRIQTPPKPLWETFINSQSFIHRRTPSRPIRVQTPSKKGPCLINRETGSSEESLRKKSPRRKPQSFPQCLNPDFSIANPQSIPSWRRRELFQLKALPQPRMHLVEE